MSSRPLVRLMLALAALLLAVLSACSSGGGQSSSAKVTLDGPCGTKEKATVTVGLFGTFGFEENGMWKEYKKRCPNITVKQNQVTASGDYWTRLKTRLASGSGLDDVVAIEQGFVADVVQNHADEFVNLQTVPQAAALKKDFYAWKWKQATTPDGKSTVGLGTDIGPEAICYRSDLLDKAGMGGTPEELAQKWTTWDKFIAFGEQYKKETGGDAFLDSAQSVFSTAVYQGKRAYSDEQGQPDLENSDGVKTAWKYATQAAQAGITAKLAQFSDAWNQAFSSGKFAAIACPTWMMPYIQSQAGPAYAGKWAIAPGLPGGYSNWGGSFLGVPADADQKAAAVALVTWLSEKDQQVKMWTSKAQGGHFPSNDKAVQDPAVADATSAYFSDAPVGQIFGGIAGKMKSLPPVGIYDTQIATVLSTQLSNVEKRGTDPDKAYAKAMDQIKQITG